MQNVSVNFLAFILNLCTFYTSMLDTSITDLMRQNTKSKRSRFKIKFLLNYQLVILLSNIANEKGSNNNQISCSLFS